MQDHTKKKQSRRARLIAGAVVGTVLSIGAVGGSASAWSNPTPTPAPTKIVVVSKTGSGFDGDIGGGYMSMRSGIRW